MTRSRSGFVKIDREAWDRLARRLPPHLRGTLADLHVECDDRTGEVRGAMRWLADRLGIGRDTLARHLRELQDAGELTYTWPTNQHGEAVVRLVHHDELRGVAGRVAGRTAGRNMPPADDGPPAASRPKHFKNFENIKNITPQPPEGEKVAISDEIEEQVERLCEIMADLVERGGDPRPTVTPRWREACRALLADGRPPQEIEDVMRWATSDDFWSPHVLSMPKLRAKYATLRRTKARPPRRSGPVHLSLDDIERRARERGVVFSEDQLKTVGLPEEALER